MTDDPRLVTCPGTAREIEITGTSPSQHAYASIRRQTEKVVRQAEMPEYGTPAGIPPEVQQRLNSLPNVQVTLSGTYDTAASSPDDVIYEDLAAMQQAGLRSAATLHPAEIVHACPSAGTGVMPCCGRTPFEARGDRMTLDPGLVTCRVIENSIREQTESTIANWARTPPPYVGQAEQLVRAMVLGPDDVLVISMPNLSEAEFEEVRKRLDSGPAPERILLVSGAEELAVLHQGVNHQQEGPKIEVNYDPELDPEYLVGDHARGCGCKACTEEKKA